MPVSNMLTPGELDAAANASFGSSGVGRRVEDLTPELCHDCGPAQPSSCLEPCSDLLCRFTRHVGLPIVLRHAVRLSRQAKPCQVSPRVWRGSEACCRAAVASSVLRQARFAVEAAAVDATPPCRHADSVSGTGAAPVAA